MDKKRVKCEWIICDEEGNPMGWSDGEQLCFAHLSGIINPKRQYKGRATSFPATIFPTVKKAVKYIAKSAKWRKKEGLKQEFEYRICRVEKK